MSALAAMGTRWAHGEISTEAFLSQLEPLGATVRYAGGFFLLGFPGRPEDQLLYAMGEAEASVAAQWQEQHGGGLRAGLEAFDSLRTASEERDR